MGLYQKLLQSVSASPFGRPHSSPISPPVTNLIPTGQTGCYAPRYRSRPRATCSGCQRSDHLAAQQALVAGSCLKLDREPTRAGGATGATASAVSTFAGDPVNLPGQIRNASGAADPGGFATNSPTDAALRHRPIPRAGTVLGQFAAGDFAGTSAFKTSARLPLRSTSPRTPPGSTYKSPRHPPVRGCDGVDRSTFGVDTGTSTFIRPTTITEGVTLAATNFHTAATLGAADAAVTNGLADLSATATVTLKDPIAGDTGNSITSAELTGTPLASLVSTSLSGTGNVTLPTGAQPGGGGRNRCNRIGGATRRRGGSNLNSLGVWANSTRYRRRFVHQAVAALARDYPVGGKVRLA